MNKKFLELALARVVSKEDVLVNPPCSYFSRCGGCQLQHLKYEFQLHFKTEVLREMLQEIAGISCPRIDSAIPAKNPFHYRSRIRLQVSGQGEVGFFKTRSHEVVPIDRCEIAEERLNEKIPETKILARKLLEKDPTQRHEIEIRREGEKIVLATDPQEEGFTQVNADQNQKLVELVLKNLELSGKEKVLELFAGEGNFTFPISKTAKSVLAIESSEASVLRAEERIKKEHFRNVQFIQSTAFRFLENPPTFVKGGQGGFDRLLLDPPRKGAFECLEGIAKLKAPLLIYVSCDPETLARDVQMLMKLGYHHDFSQVIDMFPQTYHVESVTRLSQFPT